MFPPSISLCSSCGSRLKAYRTNRKIFQSEMLEGYIRLHCTYANDITLRSAIGNSLPQPKDVNFLALWMKTLP